MKTISIGGMGGDLFACEVCIACGLPIGKMEREYRDFMPNDCDVGLCDECWDNLDISAKDPT